MSYGAVERLSHKELCVRDPVLRLAARDTPRPRRARKVGMPAQSQMVRAFWTWVGSFQVDIEPALVPLPSPVLQLATSLSSVSRANGAWKYFFSVIGDTDCISSFPPAIHLISPVTSFETGLGLLVRLQVDVASDAGRSSQRRQEPIYPSTQACSILNAEITFSVNLPL